MASSPDADACRDLMCDSGVWQREDLNDQAVVTRDMTSCARRGLYCVSGTPPNVAPKPPVASDETVPLSPPSLSSGELSDVIARTTVPPLPESWRRQDPGNVDAYQTFLAGAMTGALDQGLDWSSNIREWTDASADACGNVFQLPDNDAAGNMSKDYGQWQPGANMTLYQALANRHALLCDGRDDLKGFLGVHSLGSGKTATTAMVLAALYDSGKDVFVISTRDNISDNSPEAPATGYNAWIAKATRRPDWVERLRNPDGSLFEGSEDAVEELFADRSPPMTMRYRDREGRVLRRSVCQTFPAFAGRMNIGDFATRADATSGGKLGSVNDFHRGKNGTPDYYRPKMRSRTRDDPTYLVDPDGTYRPLRDCWIVLDEVHQILKPADARERKYSEALLAEIAREPTVKVVMLTATPGESLAELGRLLDLLVVRTPYVPGPVPRTFRADKYLLENGAVDDAGVARLKRDIAAHKILLSFVDFSQNQSLHPTEVCGGRDKSTDQCRGVEVVGADAPAEDGHLVVRAPVPGSMFQKFVERFLVETGKNYEWDRMRPARDASGLVSRGVDRGKACDDAGCREMSVLRGKSDPKACDEAGGDLSGSTCFYSGVTERGNPAVPKKFFQNSILVADKAAKGIGVTQWSQPLDKDKYRTRDGLAAWSAKLARLWDFLRAHPDDKHFVYTKDPWNVGLRAVSLMLSTMHDEETGRPAYRQYTKCRPGARPDLSEDAREARDGGFKYFVVYDQNKEQPCGDGGGGADGRSAWKAAFNSIQHNLGSTRRVVSRRKRGTLRSPETRPTDPPFLTVFVSNKNEGIDLKGVKWIHLLTPQTVPQEQQTIGRAIRFCSFLGIPKDEWKVRVVEYFSTNPEGVDLARAKSSGEKCIDTGRVLDEHFRAHPELGLEVPDICDMAGISAALAKVRPAWSELPPPVKAAFWALVDEKACATSEYCQARGAAGYAEMHLRSVARRLAATPVGSTERRAVEQMLRRAQGTYDRAARKEGLTKVVKECVVSGGPRANMGLGGREPFRPQPWTHRDHTTPVTPQEAVARAMSNIRAATAAPITVPDMSAPVEIAAAPSASRPDTQTLYGRFAAELQSTERRLTDQLSRSFGNMVLGGGNSRCENSISIRLDPKTAERAPPDARLFTRAGTPSGKWIKHLAKRGLDPMPDDMYKAFAIARYETFKRVLLALAEMAADCRVMFPLHKNRYPSLRCGIGGNNELAGGGEIDEETVSSRLDAATGAAAHGLMERHEMGFLDNTFAHGDGTHMWWRESELRFH